MISFYIISIIIIVLLTIIALEYQNSNKPIPKLKTAEQQIMQRLTTNTQFIIKNKFNGDLWKWLDSELVCLELIKGSSKFPDSNVPAGYLTGFSEATSSFAKNVKDLRKHIKPLLKE